MAEDMSLQNAGLSPYYSKSQPKRIVDAYLAKFFRGFPQFHREFNWITS
jgi:hypothetical protein